ncbi:MAG: hypothetical protein ACRDIB_08060 [Ardenticatenaceae bacterium]
MSGVSTEVVDSYTRGRQPCIFIVNGADLAQVLEGYVALDALLRAKRRKLAEEGRGMVSARELFGKSRHPVVSTGERT